ncbi:MAG: hypothetical protein NVSMB6_08020 [Burkholderiaceae bacterium]
MRTELDTAIKLNLRAFLQHYPVQTLGVFWPIRGEPDLRPLYEELAAAGMALALPQMVDGQFLLRFHAWEPGSAVVLDRWGIATPANTVPVTPEALLIPCVGFNAQGVRLGYGGGFYDRTLAFLPRPRAIGIAYELARATFDGDLHDIPMDVVLTEVAWEPNNAKSGPAGPGSA